MMKQAISGLALASFAALGATAAHAQRPAPSAANIQAGVACLLNRNAGSFSELLRTPPHSSAERREVARLLPLIQRCGGGDQMLSTSVVQLRSVVAQDAYRREFTSPQAARTPRLMVAPLLRVDQARTRAEVEPLVSTYALFECLTAAHPDLVRAYIAADPSSAAEQAAFRAFQPGLAACLPPGGSRQLAIGGAVMRGVLAEMLYRWSVVQRDGPASPFAAAPAP